jgi:TonB family protein
MGLSLSCMRKARLRPYVLVALSATMIFSPSSFFAQEQPEGQRKILSRVIPLYPELAAKIQMTGTVRVAVVVAASGKPKSTDVVGGNPLLAKSAVDALEKWRWASAPQETRELIQLNFHP